MISFFIAIWVLSLVFFAGYVWLLVLAFKKSTRWGLAVFFIPFVSFYFSAKFWAETKRPFLIHSGASAALILVALAFAFFAASESPPGAFNVRLSQPSMEAISASPQKTLTQEEEMALTFMEKTIEVMEKLPRSEKQQEMLKVMRRFIDFQRTDFSAAEVREYREAIEQVLNRTDLNKSQRENLEKMHTAVVKKDAPIVAGLEARPDGVTEAGRVNDADHSPQGRKPSVTSGAASLSASLQNEALSPKQAEAAVSALRPGAQSAVSDFSGFARREAAPQYRRTSFDQAKNHIGAPVRFKGPKGEEKDCILMGISRKNLHCRKEFSSGSFSFSYHEKEIKALKILR